MDRRREHLHGGNAWHDFIRLGIEPKQITDFSVNVNPLGPPSVIKKNWGDLFEEIKTYPTQNGDGVKQYYSKKFQIAKNNILPGNGSVELFYFVMQHLKLNSILLFSPSFDDYHRATKASKTKIIEIPLSINNSFTMPDVDVINQALKTSDGIFLGYPNNPTGTSYNKMEILFLAQQNPRKWILLDEAFIQFVDDFIDNTFLTIHRPRNIIVFHSLTKFYTLPGLRLGAVIANTSLIKQMEQTKYLWSINKPAETIVKYLINDSLFEKKTTELITRERKRIQNELSKTKKIKLFSTTANFFLAQWQATNNLDDLQRHLLKNGLYIRDARNFPLLSDNYFRFAILNKSENSKLISLINSFTKND